ncbi:MAG: putative ABC transport system permease protein, partial [Planctomycetota bacterium]
PLYGDLVLDPPNQDAQALGSEFAFIGPELAIELGLSAGDELRIGGASFRVAATVVDEPDRLDFAMTLGPRVFLGSEGLARTSLFGEKSRVRYISLYALASDPNRDELAAIELRLGEALQQSPYVSVRAHTSAQPNVERSLKQVEDYLGLVALLSLLLGGIGVSQIVRAWLAGRAQGVAVMRCLGYRSREIALVYLGHVCLLALVGSVIGAYLGSNLPRLVHYFAPELFQADSVSFTQPGAIFRGAFLGVFVALLFSLPALTAVWRVPPAAVLRSEAVPLAAPRLVRFGAPLLLLLGLFLSARLQGGAWIPALAFSGGLLVLTGLLYGGAKLAASLSGRLPRGKFGPYVEHGLAALSRPGSGSTGAIVALGLGVMVVVSMWLIETRLGHALRTALPENAPSVFLVDVQPDQWEGVRETMIAGGAQSIDAVPVVMARMREVDGQDVTGLAAELEKQGKPSWVFTREQRLTWLEELPESNELVAGELWSDPGRPEVSLEERFAADLGVSVGSTLKLDVQGVPFELAVTSVRKVDWKSFGINFFFVVEPGVLEDAPHFRIAAARLEPAALEIALQNDLAEDFPNVTMMRVRPILEKVAGVLERLAFGIRALGSFTILTGLVILAGAIGTTALRRGREAALLKALGVTRGGVTRLFAFEYALSGLVAGALGAGGALVLSWAFLVKLAQLDVELPWITLPIAALATALLATLSGLSASLRALSARPMDTLRG